MIALLLLGSALASAPEQLLARLQVQVVEHRFDNGLRLVVQTDRRAPLVAMHLQTAAGASWDVGGPGWPEAAGMAHLVEHLIYAGSERAPHGTYDRLLAAAGAETNAWTEHHAMALTALVPVEALDLLLALEADRLTGLSEEAVAARLDVERRVVAQERGIERDGPGGLDSLALRTLSFAPGHPERHSVLGSETELERVSPAQVRAFHAAAFAPSSCVLVLVGDVDPALAIESVGETLGAVPARPGWEGPSSGPEAVRPAAATHFDDIGGTTLYASWPLPPSQDSQAAAAHLLADLLGQQDQGLLGEARRRGRIERHAAWVELNPGGGRLVVQLRSRQGKAERLRRLLDRAVAELHERPLPEERLAAVTARWRSWAARVGQDPQDQAETLARCTQENGEAGCFAAHVGRHLGVQPAEVQAAARTLLAPQERVLLVVLAPGQGARSLDDAPRLDPSELR